MSSEDINCVFDEILLTENRLRQLGYGEGLEDGRRKGYTEGYQLGYSKGRALGAEFAGIYGFVVAQQQVPHTDKIQKALQNLRSHIDNFPRNNDPDENIIEAVTNIRTLYKHLTVLLGGQKSKRGNCINHKVKDYTF